MKKKFLLAALASLAMGSTVKAQHSHNGIPCSVSAEDGDLIKQRLVSNRARYGEQMPVSRNIRYLPVAFHLVGDNSGNGRVDFPQVLDALCDINRDYSDQNIQFYFLDSLRIKYNTNVHDNATSSTSSVYMGANKVQGAINVYISPTVNNSAASFYSPLGDYVFVINSEMTGSSNTLTHELGHYFSLMHTFYGWEGVDVETRYPNNAPSSINGRTVERQDGSNCGNAADMFCDTPADYYSDRKPCPYTGTAKDPSGVAITPDVSNYMSYFYDACVTQFSAGQKSAISADVTSRYASTSTPTYLNQPDPSLIIGSPQNNQIVGTGPSSSSSTTDSIVLRWNSIPDATSYMIEMERTVVGVPVGDLRHYMVYNATELKINVNDLPNANSYYRWAVRPLNNYVTCARLSNYFNFRAMSSVQVNTEQNILAQSGARLLQQPVRENIARLWFNLPQAAEVSIQLFSLDGRLQSEMPSQYFSSGEQNLEINTENLPNGMYFLRLSSEGNQHSLKMQVLR